MNTLTLSHRYLALFILAGLVSLLSLCIPAVSAMAMDGMSEMNPCAMNQQTAVCPMTVVEHLSFWQQLLTLPAKSLSLVTLLALVVFVVVRIGLQNHLHNLLIRFSAFSHDLNPFIVDHLKLQFSQGILHPKIY
ncbi:MAG: hypothetical protein HYR90_01415 [Candidatus Andersenbacteria bacterium]|nr:hypothetical protein [Candidatus Andersenbacteria bacterium]MBI3250816.1 hypothetical protein [Candidatus Andersenbacteria bacterium]